MPSLLFCSAINFHLFHTYTTVLSIMNMNITVYHSTKLLHCTTTYSLSLLCDHPFQVSRCKNEICFFTDVLLRTASLQGFSVAHHPLLKQ